MAEDWLVDVRKYDADADEIVVKKIVNHCGIALRSKDASLVAFSDRAETGRVRESFLKKKLALTDDDATLDAAIAGVGERMKADRTKNRVTVYYLLAQHFDLLDLFGGTKRGTAAPVAAVAAAAAAGTTAAPLAAMSTPAAGTPAEASGTPVPPKGGSGGGGPGRGRLDDDFDLIGFGCLALAIILAGFAFAAFASGWLFPGEEEETSIAAPAPATAPAPAPTPAPVQAVPEGSGVVSAQRDEKPMLTVYFDTGAAEVTPDFAAASAEVMAYLEGNPDATLAISGYNDPSGNAELNAELSKNRAQNVQAALVAAGVDEARTELVKPDDATTTDMTPAEARRVEVTIVEG